MSRWTKAETAALEEMKKQLAPEFEERFEAIGDMPEVSGDRRLMRFLRGFNLNVEKAVKCYKNFLNYRKEKNVDFIRNEILYGGKNHPRLFPNGDLIMELFPQIVIAPNTFDNVGQPVTLETFGFDPNKVLETITVEQYLTFLIYCLEFRTLILEEISEKREKEYLLNNPEIDDRVEGYGVIIKLCCLRDLNGVGIKHLGNKSQSIISVALEIAVNNYSEYLGKSHMVNVPWIFDTIWIFVKRLLDESTTRKISLIGNNFMTELLKDLPLESIPVSMGGKLKNENYGYLFDIKSGGLYDIKKVKIPNDFQILPQVPIDFSNENNSNTNNNSENNSNSSDKSFENKALENKIKNKSESNSQVLTASALSQHKLSYSDKNNINNGTSDNSISFKSNMKEKTLHELQLESLKPFHTKKHSHNNLTNNENNNENKTNPLATIPQVLTSVFHFKNNNNLNQNNKIEEEEFSSLKTQSDSNIYKNNIKSSNKTKTSKSSDQENILEKNNKNNFQEDKKATTKKEMKKEMKNQETQTDFSQFDILPYYVIKNKNYKNFGLILNSFLFCFIFLLFSFLFNLFLNLRK